jgi:hypothetical protein
VGSNAIPSESELALVISLLQPKCYAVKNLKLHGEALAELSADCQHHALAVRGTILHGEVSLDGTASADICLHLHERPHENL